MPFCPKCRSEYVAGTTVCDDCGEALLAELPPQGARTPLRGALVEAWHAQGEMEAQMIRSVLESNGIDAMFSGESLRLTHGLTVDGLAEVRILVRPSDAKRAHEVIGTLEDMRQCPACGYPARSTDRVCHSCQEELLKS